MNNIHIPIEFQIFGHTYTVKLKKKVNKENDLGTHSRDKKQIKLKEAGDSYDQVNVEETYLHEVMHCVLDHLGYDELSDDEAFVSQMSKALHQILKTSVYEKASGKEPSPGKS